MPLNQSLIAELKQEAANTRKILERVAVDQNEWRPHDKSMKLGSLAMHVAELEGWAAMIMATDELDFAKFNYKAVMPATVDELLAKHDENVEQSIAILENCKDEDFDKPWSMRNGEMIFFTLPKKVALRTYAYNHMYHHRGQLSVYLRLLNIHVPGMYGPSADDMAVQMANSAAN
jgi:uncharacterized damage-inducible protein DinB